MSDRDFIRKLWLNVIASLIVIVAGALITGFVTVKITQSRSIRNEASIRELERNKEPIGFSNGIHQTLLNATITNAENIKDLGNKVDDNQLFIVKELLEIKGYVKTN